MHFELSDERRMLADTARRFIADRYDIKTRHANAARDEGFNRETWAALADLGLIGALLPPEVGGFGGAGEDIAVVFESLGQGLVVEPFLATGILGAQPIALAGSDAQKALLEEVIAGNLLLALAHGEPDSRYETARVSTRAERSGDGWKINGSKAVVLNGDSADKLVVSARTSGDTTDTGGISLFLVDATAAGVARRGYGNVDGGHAAEVTLKDVTVGADALIGQEGAGFETIEATYARGVIALAAESFGALEVARDMTLEYLKTRKQFGRTLGTFQALQHRMVDLCIEIEQVRSAILLAISTLDADRRTRELNVSAAKNLLGRVNRLVAEETIQLHGGMAMTWEYPLGHYAKRLTMIDHQLGDTDYHLQRYIDLSNSAA
ncbi:MAG: acyl-CoA dehydrogenase family protein [Alphaproteobacteria bacterium]|nr:acyl-CoA dehydrogenase family protein [Alphaproteobacteria bacterium]